MIVNVSRSKKEGAVPNGEINIININITSPRRRKQ
jgi:hypothetical protein